MTHTTEQAFNAPAQEPHAPVAPAPAQAADPSIDEIIAWTENPRTFAVNRLPAHSEHRFFDHEPLPGETSDLIQSLDGEWNVGLIDLADGESAREALGAFASVGAASCASPAAAADAASASPAPASAALAAVSFRRIPVPSNLQNEGVLPHQYVNQQYPWSGHETLNPPQIPHDHNHVALYRRVFAPSAKVAAAISAVAATTSNATSADTPSTAAAATTPVAAQIRPRVTLTFHGAATAIAVWLNGRFVGYAEDSFTPSEFDVTDALRPGRNVLSVACWQYTTASWLEDQDFWRLHGIFRFVELAAQPVAHVENLRITPDFDAGKGAGLLDVTASIRGIGGVAALAAAAAAGTAAVAARGTESDDSSDSAAAASSVLIEASLTDANGRTVWSARKDAADLLDQAASAAADAESAPTAAPAVAATATTDAAAPASAPTAPAAHWTATIPSVHPWSAEDPYRYTLTVRILAADAQSASAAALSPIEVAAQRIGFRRFTIDGGIMKLNGKRILFKGVDRHEFDARHGRAVPESVMISDIRFFKRHNINAVRTSHYPNNSRWYDLCDEYGIYVIDETNLETHGSWTSPGDIVTPDTAVPGSKPEWRDACLDRIASMIGRDYNHPSVLIWSLGNESYAGSVFKDMYDYAHAVDAMRPVHYEGVFWNHDWDCVTDMETRMYAKPAEIKAYLDSNPAKPYISCEYAHSMGNSTGGLHIYTDLERYPQYQGGFIWDFVDQALFQQQADGTERLAYGGDFGDRPSDYEFAGNGIVFADRTPTPKAQEVKQLYANVKIAPDETGVTITNDNLFVSTAGYLFTARTLVNGVERWHADYRFDVPAGQTKRFDVAFPSVDAITAGAAGGCGRGCGCGRPTEVTFEVDQRLAEATDWAEAGYELTFGQHTVAVGSVGAVGAAEQPAAAPAATTTGAATTTATSAGRCRRPAAVVVTDRFNDGMHTADAEVLLSKTVGGIVSFRHGDRELVLRRPNLTTFRPLTDNDRGNASGFDRAQWMAAGRYAKCVSTTIAPAEVRGGAGLVADYVYELAEPNRTHVTVHYDVDARLRVHLRAEYPGIDSSSVPTLPAFGIEWTLPAQYDRLRFYGLGPEETYRDRIHGAKLGVYSRTAAQDFAPYLVPQETGNHEGVRWAEITDAFGRGMRVSAVGAAVAVRPFAVSLLPYGSLAIEEAMHADELPPVRHTFLRLLAAQMGVGGDDTWGAPVHPEFQLPADQPLTLDVMLELL